MSSSSVCQGLQSCLEPGVMEPPRVLRLTLVRQQGSKISQPNNNTNTEENDTKSNVASGWSFLQTLSHNKTEDQVYVHPTVKRSSSVLSEKSLEMCTESLGSETGSNDGESSDDMSLFSSDITTTCSTKHTTITAATTTTLASCESKRGNRTCNFPPPLTSITDFGGVHVVPHRHGGRLILEAVTSPSPRPYFQAERGDGRLRLCLVESFSAYDVDDDEVGYGEEEEESEENKEEKEVCGEEGDDGAEEELEECVENVEDEMGLKKFSRPSRCKESGKRYIFGDGLATLCFPLSLSVSE